MSKARIEGHEPNIGKSDHAGMPKDVYMESYPKSVRLPMNENIDDSMSEIDMVDGKANGKRNRYRSNQH